MKPSMVIVGLGNIGDQYRETRHNVGFQAIELLGSMYGTGEWRDMQKFSADVMEARVVTAPVLLVKPRTYMNLSGESVTKILRFYQLEAPQNILVLCDDIDLPPGVIRFRLRGGPGTHNGLKSIVDHIGEEFPRIRIGIGAQPPGTDLAAFVLSRPSAEEKRSILTAMEEIPAKVRFHILQ